MRLVWASNLGSGGTVIARSAREFEIWIVGVPVYIDITPVCQGPDDVHAVSG
jgi:hypothetical protein